MIEISYTLADVETNFDKRDLKLGRSYWRAGAVQDLTIGQSGLYLKAKVRGTHPKPYDVTVHIDPNPGTKKHSSRLIFATECSCKVGLDCKHAAAVCLEALSRQKKSSPNAPLSEGRLITRTNRKIKDKLVKQGQAENDVPSPSHIRAKIPLSSNDALGIDKQGLQHQTQAKGESFGQAKESVLYFLEMTAENWGTSPQYLHIRPVIAAYLKNGGFSAPRRTTPNQLAYSTAQYATLEDNLIGKLMRDCIHSKESEFRSPPCDPEVFDLVLRKVLATGRSFFHSASSQPLSLGEKKLAKLGWRQESDGSQLPAAFFGDDPASNITLFASHPWYLETKTGKTGPLEFEVSMALAYKFLSGPKILPGAIAGIAEEMTAMTLREGIPVPRSVKIEQLAPGAPVPCLRLISYLSPSDHGARGDKAGRRQHLAMLHFDYKGVVVDSDAPKILRRYIDDRLIETPRNIRAEAKFVEYLTVNSGFVPSYIRPTDVPRSRLAFSFAGDVSEHMRWIDFLHEALPQLAASGWNIDIEDGFAADFKILEADKDDDAWQANLQEQEGGSWWFSLNLGIMVEGVRVALLPLLVKALRRLREPSTSAIESLARSGKLYVDLPDGRTLALPFERVRDILTTLVELYDQPLNNDGSLSVSLDLAGALARIDSATRMRWLGGKKLQTMMERLKTFTGLTEILPPRGLKAVLRPYQQEGLNWLQFLRDFGLGGILADDMGLGKTIQALAHIMVEKEANRLDYPCLIVCPTSLIPNWLDEVAKFAPELKVLSLHGKDRAKRFRNIPKSDLVLTTYPLLSRDSATLLPITWHMVVLDEAQAIKNPTSQATQIVCELKARHRLCLTGTPIENHLGEVWSHFAFLMPGMLGSHKDFTKRFRMPIEKHQDNERRGLLATRLKPFILRRNKSDVAKELPPKTEIIHHVEFESAQSDLYETLRLTMHEKVQDAVAEKGFGRSRIIILDALLKLRQVCCDPRLIKLEAAKNVKRSAKLESLMEMVPEMVEEGRRILLFSQFTSMLDLIKPELDKINIPFVELRGDTKDRKTPVTRFQNGEVPVFLISLKAGGTGLNLTAADTVIHYDPWWNPAVESQASDRAHRIGQDKPVFIYKFIVKNTVEDRIVDLQNRKRGLASALMEERPDAAAAFEINDLEFLFREST